MIESVIVTKGDSWYKYQVGKEYKVLVENSDEFDVIDPYSGGYVVSINKNHCMDTKVYKRKRKIKDFLNGK